MKGGGKLHNSKITLAISDQRKHFYQWDTGRKLIVTGLEEGSQIHFHREGMAEPYTLLVYAGEDSTELFCNVPDEMLQEAKSFTAYTYVTDKDGGKTCSRKNFSVEDKPKPSDYVYTETEIKSWNDFYKRLDELELGARALIDVEALPENEKDINPALLYRTIEGVYWYDAGWHKVADESDLDILEADIEEAKSIAKGAHQAVSFGNYETMITALNALPKDTYKIPQSIMIVTLDVPDLWVSGIAEESVAYTYVDDASLANEIKTNGSVQVGYYVLSALETQKVDLTEYVKNTDYASKEKTGVFKLGDNMTLSNGKLYFFVPTENDFKKATRPNDHLRVSNTDIIAKYGLAYNNTVTLTDEEKASALAWLGAVANTQLAEQATAGLIKLNPHYGFGLNGSGHLYALTTGEADIAQRNKGGNISQRPIKYERLDSAVRIALTTNSEVLTDEEKTAALKWLGALVDTDVEYTCDKYNHQAIIEGYLPDWYGYAASVIPTADDLSGYEIDVECDESYGSVHGTVSLAGARVITLDGGYALSVAPSGVSSSCPDARVIVVTDTEKFNKMCSCDLESVGIYLSNTQVDNDVMQMTYQTKVTALRATTAKISNAHLYLEGHPLIKSLMAKIEALEKKA